MGRGGAHILAILAAAATVMALHLFMPASGIPRQALVSGHVGNLGSNYPAQLGTLERLGHALEHGEAVVLLGSSELTSSDLRFIPYHFLARELAAPVMAYGHAYFQSLGMYFLLAAQQDKLSPPSRVVIMVSPGWFDSRGLDRAAFKEHVLPLMPRLMDQAQARDALAQWWRRRGNTDVAIAAAAELAYQLRSQAEQTAQHWFSPPQASGPMPPPKPWSHGPADWPSLHAQAQQAELPLMANNSYGVRQDYLDTFLRELTPARLDAYSADMNPAAELADLERLMALLARQQAKSLLVLQPLNPLVYRDLERFEPVRQRILALCAQYTIPCMDMYGAQPYAIGTLRDGQHLGEPGWLAVSRKIADVMSQ